MEHLGVASPFVHTGLVNGTTYYFVVTALNGSGESPDSAEVNATPVGIPGALAFGSSTYSVNESGSSIDITVNRSVSLQPASTSGT